MQQLKEIIDRGFKPYRWVKGKLIEDSGDINFSSMQEGGLDIRFIKDDLMVIMSLEEYNKAPVLKWYKLRHYN
jgi:hypothetical protein